jgi:ATP-binding cassette subfamily C protein
MIIIGGSLLFVFMLSSVHKSRKAGMAISHYSRQQIFNLSEHLNGIKEVKAYGMEQAQLNYLISLRQEIEVGQLKFTLLQSKLDMSYTIVAAFFISAVFYVSIAWLHLPLESLALVVVIFARLWPRISSLQNSLHAVNLALPAFKSILALEQEAKANAQLIETMPNETKRVLTDSLENIQFENMSFAYTADTANILSEVNLTIKAGEFIGCVGSSGSGKSTLADLLMGLSTPLRGKILINGYDLQQVKAHYQQWISYVPQDIFLFNASIRENLLWAAHAASEYEIWEVLKLVQLEQLVLNLPERLDSVVGDRGISLSGGERQRLVLARALIRKPQLLILDEATSALDEQNEHLVQQALEKLHGKLTVFVIAHRLATLTNATKIIKLESGVIEVIRN